MELPNEMESSNLQQEIAQLQNGFYSETKKNSFFKKHQKFDCAKQVHSQIPLELLLNQTCRILPHSTKVYIDYPTMKSYASPEIFEAIADHIFGTCLHAKLTLGALEIHLNLDGFTMSGADRYREIIVSFCNKCLRGNVGFAPIMTNFVIYNTPSTIDSIKPLFMPLMLEEVRRKVKLMTKRDSEPLLKDLGVL